MKAGSNPYNFKAEDQPTVNQDTQLRRLEEVFYTKVNHVISHKVTPVYNTFMLIFAAVFAYFTMVD